MRIAIDIRSTLKKPTGIGSYTLNLIRGLAEVDSENSYYLYSRKKILDFKKHLPRLPARNFSHCCDYFKKGPWAILSDVDVFHTSSYDLQKPRLARFIVTVHDVIQKAYPSAHTKRTIEEIDARFRRILSQVDTFVADSYSTKSDLMKFYGVPGSKIHVIYPGINVTRAIPRLRSGQANNDYESYILYVGTLEPRKNVDGLIRAFTWLKKKFCIRHKLYLVGMKGWMFENIFKAHKESEFKKDIVFKGHKTGKSLQTLYENASMLVYPSFYEGFGFPIVEAFSYGIPVVTSKTSSCGEIAGDSALLIDPSDYKEIGEAILSLINDEKLKRDLTKKGLDRAKEFTWTRTAMEFVKLFTRG